MRLFSEGGIHQYKDNLLMDVLREIEDLTEEELLNTDDSLKLIFISKFKIPQIILHDIYRKDGGYKQIDVSGDSRFWISIIGEWNPVYRKARIVNVHISFEGNHGLLGIQPSTYQMGSPKGEIKGNEIIMEFPFFPNTDSKESFGDDINKEIELLKKYVEWMNEDIEGFNKLLYNSIPQALSKRRGDLEKEKDIIEGIDIPEKEVTNQKIGFVKPINKINVIIENLQNNEDPILENSIYEGITEHINSLGINLERCKSRVRSLDEESLRDTFFMALNSAYKGFVSSEAFNRNGKTDILIRYQDSNLYVSEFKIWGSHEYFSKGIDQLLNNMTWRDSKCSYVVFSKNSGFSRIIKKAKELISEHPDHIKFLKQISDSCLRFQFRNKTDTDKTLILTLHLFNLV